MNILWTRSRVAGSRTLMLPSSILEPLGSRETEPFLLQIVD